jgi:xanthine dehydrogenase YagR molybdenum-binding subunit
VARLAQPGTYRVDALEKVTGQPIYSADHQRPDLLHAALAVATIARGRVLAINTADASREPGVRLVMTHADMEGVQPAGFIGTGGFAFQSMQPMLSPEIAYRGQPIAMVVADTPEAAVEGARLIRARYSEAPFRSNIEGAPESDVIPQDGSPLPQQLFADKRAGDADAQLSVSEVTIDARFTSPNQHQNPMELIATLAEWQGERLIIREGTQNSSAIKHGLARQLGLSSEQVDVISPQTGGGFGQKNSQQMQTVLAAIAARRTGRPVKLVVPRGQLFHDTSYRPQSHHRIRLGARRDGKIMAAIHESDQQTSRHDLFGSFFTDMTARLYAIENFRSRERLVRTDVQTPGYMRGPFEQPAGFAFEAAMDELAEQLGMDPVELRLRNDGNKDPITGRPYSSRFLAECLRLGAERFEWSRRNPAPGSMRTADGQWVGLGMAAGAYKAATAATIATITADRAGKVRLAVAGHEMGQGIRSAIANVLASRLRVPIHSVQVSVGVTTSTAQHLTAGSWGTATAVPAAASAADALLAEIRKIRPDASGADIGAVVAASGRPEITAEARHKPPGAPDEIYDRAGGGNVVAQGPVYPEFVSMSYAAHFVEVHVEPTTRRVRVHRVASVVDCGRVASPTTATSQVTGGVVWGIGAALREVSEVDPRFGGFLNNDLAEYVIPVNADIGSIDVSFIDRPDPLLNNVGVKGLGEVAMVGVAPAIVNALYHATGGRFRDLPVRLDDMFEGAPLAVSAGGRGNDAGRGSG